MQCNIFRLVDWSVFSYKIRVSDLSAGMSIRDEECMSFHITRKPEEPRGAGPRCVTSLVDIGISTEEHGETVLVVLHGCVSAHNSSCAYIVQFRVE